MEAKQAPSRVVEVDDGTLFTYVLQQFKDTPALADNAREGERFGIRSTVESVDMAGVHAYKDGVVKRLHQGLQGLVKGKQIDLTKTYTTDFVKQAM